MFTILALIVVLALAPVWAAGFLIALMFHLIMPDWDVYGNDVPARESLRSVFRIFTFQTPVYRN